MARFAVLVALAIAQAGLAAAPAPEAIEALLNETAERLSSSLGEQGRGYSYYAYGTSELEYAVGDLDGDGRPEIAARAVYFLGVGSYDLVDVFSDQGAGYERVGFLNLYHLGLEDEVEALEIRQGLLHIATVGVQRGVEVRRCGVVRWQGPDDVVPTKTPCAPSRPVLGERAPERPGHQLPQ